MATTNNAKIIIADLAEKRDALLSRGAKLLGDGNADTDKIIGDEKPLSIAFAGQYSAGKSTILKALTGVEDIAVGEGITTQEARTYNWKGLSVIDTPGICTNLRPEHDEISKNAIANSDLLVYIVTCELFDDFIGNKFRELLIDEKKADETILVVNKMAKVGNTEEMRNNKLCDLAKVTTPYKPEELHTVFIDAQSYLDSCSETDPKMKQALEKRGNFSALIDVLNKFAADNNKLSGKLTTPLYVLRNRIDAAISEMHAQDSDNETAERENELIRKNETLSNFKAELWDSVKIIREEIIDKINEQIDDIDTDGKQPEEVQRMVQEAVSSIVLIIDCFRGKVGEKIKDLEYDLEYDYEELSIDDLDSLDYVPNE